MVYSIDLPVSPALFQNSPSTYLGNIYGDCRNSFHAERQNPIRRNIYYLIREMPNFIRIIPRVSVNTFTEAAEDASRGPTRFIRPWNFLDDIPGIIDRSVAPVGGQGVQGFGVMVAVARRAPVVVQLRGVLLPHPLRVIRIVLALGAFIPVLRGRL